MVETFFRGEDLLKTVEDNDLSWEIEVEWTIDHTPPVYAVEVGSCAGCAYSNRKRPQKCSCCRRNRYLKDCYEEG